MPMSANAASVVESETLDDALNKLEGTCDHAVLTSPKSFKTEQREYARPEATEILVRHQGCGVCASSLPVWEGRPWFEYPLAAGAPGHEGWGIITAVGSEVKDLQVGQRVATLAQNAFAQMSCVAAEHAVPLPAELDHMPFPGEAIGCAMNIFRRADIQRGQTVAIIGAGFLGLLLTQLASAAGAQVYAMSRRASARDQALSAGAVAAFDTEDWWGNAHKIVELTDGRGCERVVEVTGLQFALDTATELVGEHGKLVIAGFHQDGLRQVNMQTWNWRGIDVINAHERSTERCVQGIRDGVQATLSGRIRPTELLTHRFSLDQLDEAFECMVQRPDDFIKGWVQL